MEKTLKKELKTLLNAELYDEMRFVFRPDQLENVIYKPEMLGEKKWQCCCGSESELEICPICGMEKHTVFSKVNAGYLAHHRKARIARKRKAMQDQQAMMAAQLTKKNKGSKKSGEKTKKIGSLIAILVLCIAIIASVAIIFGGNETKKPPETTPVVTNQNDDTGDLGNNTDDVTEPEETPEVTEPVETDPPETTPPPEPIVVPSESINKNPSTVLDGKWPSGASGNVSVGGLYHCGEEYDYSVLPHGIFITDKDGKVIDTIETEFARGVSGNGNTLYYIDAENYVHRYNTESKRDFQFSLKASKIICYFDELYYTSPDESGLFACNYDGYKTKTVTSLPVYAINNTADKLYFSTDESLAVVTSKDGPVNTFCKDGAKATSIFEITGWLFYTSADGKLKFFNPSKKSGFSIEYPIYNRDITHVVAYENRIYVRAVKPGTSSVQWYSTKWTPGTKLFNPAAFKFTGITTDALYVSNNAIYDGNLNRKPIS